MKRRKKKLSIKKIIRFFLPIVILLVIFINRYNILYFFQSKITGYEFETVKLLHETNIYNDVKKKKHSDTLEKIITTEHFKKEYVNYYLDIDYYSKDNYFVNINKLIDIGYNSNDINQVYSNLTDDEVNILLDNDYLKDIVNILKLNYFHRDYLLRYIKYINKNELDYVDGVTYVNIGLDNEYYSNIEKIDKPDDILVLVNKYHALDSKYVPSDLEAINTKYNRGSNNKMRSVAKKAFEKMCEAALKDKITIYSGSAYRSYSYQLNLYNNYVYTDGKFRADTYAARAGHSEHQTGLATDIMNAKGSFISGSDKEYTWLIDNSYKYGFILRYPKGKEDITGYMYEEWHFRYLGEDVAKEVYKMGITYDEYVARK